MRRRENPFAKILPACLRLALGALVMLIAPSIFAYAAAQAESDVPPDATPQIQQINPQQAAAGAHLTVRIDGSSFSAGAYVSSISAAIHVESSRRISATQLEARLSVSASSQPSTVSLLVSNPASRAAEAAFKIVAGEAGPATPSPSSEPPKGLDPATPSTPIAPAGPTAPAVPAAPTSPSVPPAPVAPVVPESPPSPEVSTIEPAIVGRGFDVDLKISGKNFKPGAKVSFANPGIRVLGVGSASSSRLTVHIKVASDAAPGAGSLFVVNPDDSEVEARFEVAAKTAAKTSTPIEPALAPVDAQRYEAYHLGSPAEIFQVHGKVKGALVVAGGALRYEEDGKTLINISLSEIREIKTSSIATATFHVSLITGKTFHFAPASLRPADARDLVNSLRKELPH